MMTCPVCDTAVSELIEHRRLDEPVCYWCARALLDLDYIPPIEREDG